MMPALLFLPAAALEGRRDRRRRERPSAAGDDGADL